MQTVPHEWLQEQACGGRKCRVLCWYPGRGDEVYLDERMEIQVSTWILERTRRPCSHVLRYPHSVPCPAAYWTPWEKSSHPHLVTAEPLHF